MNWVTEDTQAYQLQNYLSITAGDFDKTGKDRIVVYAAMDGETMALVELSAVSAESSVTLSEVKQGNRPFECSIYAGWGCVCDVEEQIFL